MRLHIPPPHCSMCGKPFPWKRDETPKTEQPPTAPRTNEIFVVHGHDEEMKHHVARTLTDLGLDPIILSEQANKGMTLIEKLVHSSGVGFAVVLISPDDLGYAAKKGPNSAKHRPRQNVVLELGYFIGLLGRDFVCTLKRGDDLELPSDFLNVAYTAYDDANQWRLELVRELQAAGYSVDANSLIKRAAV